jgi:NADPH:quinone reductase-like Zn-dependent oxidoreductase
MKVVELQREFGLEQLRVTERPDPEPGHGQVVIRLGAASLNYRDLLMVRGQYNPRQPLPLIPCSDGVGRIVAVGDDVTRFRPGDRVAPIFAQTWISGRPSREQQRSTLGGPLDGTLSEQMLVDQSGLVAVPDHLSDEQAACLPCAGLTAWSALMTFGQLKKGETVLIQGTGGVSIFALQFALLAGARPIVTSSSNEKLDRVRALGAWRTINYREVEDWDKQALELTDGRGVDHVVEVGGAGTLARSLSAVRFGGTISMIGVLSGVASKLSITPILMRQIRVQGIFVGNRDGFETMNAAITDSGMKPPVDRVFDLAQAQESLTYLATGRHFGKICIRFPQ